ncbi:heavy metal sensor histidine kinase [Sulfuritalea hydrogenivorans]|uniref:Sensor protein n=1 Tax=Sulfuritalea hydrogenivorans sk43H TaxID=1223802 RepID=W0SCE9_9PROT|nr:heavy metal sensor histidine kinase [Sulfuritalea hydrogenivorans]BAO28425.1 heavy metal sensor signal transduction histidine kinase [Sulfuritalea hydrogenivorans sk43H]
MRCGTSITARLTLLFAAVSTAVLLGLGMLIGNAVEQHFVEQDMEVLSGKTQLAANLLEQLHSPAESNTLLRQLDDSLVGHHGLAVVVLDAEGKRVFATANAAFPRAMLEPAGAGSKPRSWTQAGQPWRGIASLLPTGDRNLSPMLVAVAVDISHHEHFMESFRQTLWLFVAIAAILVGFLGWVVARRGLAPLQAMRRDAASVTANRLDTRLSLDAVPVELAELAETLNDMLARLEDSFQRLKDFSSDLAHELRTPISNLMTQTQVALARARSEDEYREVLASNAEEYERLARMVGDMLFLAQADHGLVVPSREPVDLALQVRELFDFFDALAEEKGLRLTLTGSGQVSGDKLMLRRALANLISNAIRHTPAGGAIRVDIESSSEGTKLSVENSGEPIPREQMSRIFDRFYRGDPSRHEGGEGAGLGLAITRSIIRAHGGEIGVRSVTGGVCFELRMT